MFELCRYRVANFTSCSEFMSESETVAKNRIEFQWGSKLQGTSSEALVRPDAVNAKYHVIANATYNRNPVPAKFRHVTNIDTCTLLCCDYSTLWEALLGMFMKIFNFWVFYKMVSGRKILWFPSEWGVNHLKRWRNGEVVGKKPNHELFPEIVTWHCQLTCVLYYSMCQGPFFYHKGAFNKNALLFLEIWLLLAEMYCPKV